MSDSKQGGPDVSHDVHQLHNMGYAQELARRMGGFSNFAISFSIICILAGGITSFAIGLDGAGGASIGIGWVVGGVFALIVAFAMGQIASAYPTAGGLYHWGSILGGRGWGWATAWFNLLGLIFVTASVDYGVYFLFRDLFLGGVLGMDVSSWGSLHAIVGVGLILVTQALFNHFGIRLTTRLTDFSGYLIFVVAVILTGALLLYAPSLDFSRLFTFTNFTGTEGSFWPPTDSMFVAFLLSLLLVCYTITGFDASAHTSEETHDPGRAVPRGMWHSVLWSIIFGYVMVCAFVLAMPSVEEGVKQGFNVFPWLMDSSPMPEVLRKGLFIGIVIANYLCGLACMTSASRMMYAFARDDGFHAASPFLHHVSPKYRTPTRAIWVVAVLALLTTIYADAYAVLSAGSAVLLYLSYVMPVGAGFLAEGKTWTQKGPFNLGALSKPVAILAVLGGLILAWTGFQAPNEKVLYATVGLIVFLAIAWFALERKRFEGPPTGEKIAARQSKIAEIESKLDQGISTD